jgi:hypothetical protein
MSNLRGSTELPFPVQLASLLLLWAVWGVTLTQVLANEWRLAQEERYYTNPKLIYLILLAGIPSPLVVAGRAFLRRHGPASRLGAVCHFLYGAVGIVTVLGTLVVLLGGCLALVLPGPIRE